MRHLPKIVFALFIAAPFLASATEAAPYFPKETISPALLTPPLAPHSDAWNAEVASIITKQQHADATEITKAEKERVMRPELMTLATEPNLTRERFPLTYHLLDKVRITTREIGDYAKNYWHTKRPYIMDSRIKPLIEPHDNPAYPSGHTVGSYVWAYTLALAIPEKQKDFLQRADEIAQHRVLVGMHYPHDLRGGRELALLTMGALLQNKDFLHDVENAKNEIKQHPNAFKTDAP